MPDVLDQLKKAINTFDAELSREAARQAVEEEIDPIKALNAMTETLRVIGDAFGKGEIFLPELVGAANAMLGATPILEAEIARRGTEKQSAGKVVLGTVYGDIHSIGKNMVCALLRADGFEVNDLGVDVKAEEFVNAVRKHQPEILALSALLTTTSSEQRKVIQALKEEGIRDKVKIMVGGGAISARFAEDIGADGYDPTAPGAVKLARSFIGKPR
jgi:corrinoid protein of di/trimethylamine methyltransferase